MKAKALTVFKSKFFNPCRDFLQAFKFKLKKPVFIRALRPRPHHTKPRKSVSKRRFSNLASIFKRRSRKMNRVEEFRSVSEPAYDRVLFPSPITPAYVRVGGSSRREASSSEEVEDACKSFENYLVDMIVEEGKVKDLTDVEELLYCWKSLKSPVFIDIVSRFYGELCKDLFSPVDDEDVDVSSLK